eukprot:196636-Chlamydomonas_euryale.AAC.1
MPWGGSGTGGVWATPAHGHDVSKHVPLTSAGPEGGLGRCRGEAMVPAGVEEQAKDVRDASAARQANAAGQIKRRRTQRDRSSAGGHSGTDQAQADT